MCDNDEHLQYKQLKRGYNVAKGAARRCVPPGPFEFRKNERRMKIICIIDHSTIFDIAVGHEKDLSTDSIF